MATQVLQPNLLLKISNSQSRHVIFDTQMLSVQCFKNGITFDIKM